MHTSFRPVGDLLRDWRQRRRLSQLDLALDTEISTKHLSFLETGRSQPSREMVVRLAERLAVPLRERNALLLAAGYAPAYAERALDDPELAPARAAVERILEAHAPCPAIAVDRHWTLVAANRAVAPLLAGAAASLLDPPVNVLRLSLHPEGLAPRIQNLAEWRAHLLERLRRQVELTGDPALIRLKAELEGYVPPAGLEGRAPRTAAGARSEMGHPKMSDLGGIAVPLRLATQGRVLSFISMTTVFGTAAEVTLSEIVLETFFPADPATAEALRAGNERP